MTFLGVKAMRYPHLPYLETLKHHLGHLIAMRRVRVSKPAPRVKNFIPLDERTGKMEAKILSDSAAFQLPDVEQDNHYRITYVNHYGLEVPGHIIFDGYRYRTNRVTTYDNLTDAVIALVKGD
jgi:hypothetical protein